MLRLVSWGVERCSGDFSFLGLHGEVRIGLKGVSRPGLDFGWWDKPHFALIDEVAHIAGPVELWLRVVEAVGELMMSVLLAHTMMGTCCCLLATLLTKLADEGPSQLPTTATVLLRWCSPSRYLAQKRGAPNQASVSSHTRTMSLSHFIDSPRGVSPHGLSTHVWRSV